MWIVTDFVVESFEEDICWILTVEKKTFVVDSVLIIAAVACRFAEDICFCRSVAFLPALLV